MSELLCHLIGDYVLQNHWMANRKTSSFFVAAVHGLFYSIPFLFLGISPAQWLVSTWTHVLIDHYRIAKLWVDFWGVGTPGKVMKLFGSRIEQPSEAPPFLGVWLLIIVDNTLHLCINHAVLVYL